LEYLHKYKFLNVAERYYLGFQTKVFASAIFEFASQF